MGVQMADDSLSKFYSFDNYPLLIPAVHAGAPRARICVICMASYALGSLHGEWMDATEDVDIIHDKINKMLKRSPVDKAVDWAIYTYYGFGSLVLNENDSVEQIHHKAIFVSRYGEWSVKLLDYYHHDIELAEEVMVEHYQGEYLSELIFAKNLLDKKAAISIPEFVKHYIDYGSFRQDIFRHEYFSIAVGGSVRVFSHGHSIGKF
jgi:antirestriction protein